MLRPIPSRHLTVIGVAALVVGACVGSGSDTTIASTTTVAETTTTTTPIEETDEYRALESQLAAAEEERDLLAGQSEPAVGAPIDLTDLTEARGSGDPDQIRTFYTDDAVTMPIGVDEVQEGKVAGGRGMGDDIDREAAQHAGGTYKIFNPIRVVDIATFTWRWDIFEFMTTGASIPHYHDDLIWREYIEYQAGQ
jgi:hypothetical protein